MENKGKRLPRKNCWRRSEQPIFKNTKSSISQYEEDLKSFSEMQREMQLSFRPNLSQSSFHE